VQPNLLLPAFSITALTMGTAPSPTETTDVSMLFGQVASLPMLSGGRKSFLFDFTNDLTN